MIDFFTVLLTIFVLLMYIYLILVRKSIVIKSTRKKIVYVLVFGSSLVVILLTVGMERSLDQRIRGFLAVLLIFSFLLDTKGFSDDRLILGPFDRKGVLYQDIEKIALLLRGEEIRLNFFKNGRRGPMMSFSIPLEELLAFLSDRLTEEAQINILVDEEN
ncbi:hypothetical protein BCR25_13090 [Enterococcus termitis]|uniref:DUF5673 domain-containing protein n=1 Tax=Enterococcus termitis TaxID=332950 RepID=A0A1E5G706_9ENTE|nr:hypothetical protein BCR25_13090 [Enterococcus termitis]